MSVETALGLHPDLVERLRDVWDDWTKESPELALVADPATLRGWCRRATASDVDDVLYALVTLASTDTPDGTLATQALAWALLPGATQLAWQLRTLTDDVDHLVASELWACIRTFPLQRRKVAANMVRDLRKRVLAECALLGPMRAGRQGAPLVLVGDDLAWDQEPATEASAREELEDFLDWSCGRGSISRRDRQLVLELVDVARAADPGRHRSGLGLMTDQNSQEVGRRLGMSETTVRRHARRVLDALTLDAPQHRHSA